METPCIALSVAKGNNFAWQQGYKDVDDSELETLLTISRELVRSLEAEVQARQLSTKPQLSSALSECIQKLNMSIKKWRVLGRLDKKETDLLRAACNALTVEQATRDGRLYQTFLCDVNRNCNRTSALLCAASLGKQRIVCLNVQERINLLQHLKLTQDALALPALDLLAEDQLPKENSSGRSLKRKFSTEMGDTVLLKRKFEPTPFPVADNSRECRGLECRSDPGKQENGSTENNTHSEVARTLTGSVITSGPGSIETAFLLSPETFEQIWSHSHEWQAEELQTSILTIPAEDRVASIVHSIPRSNAIRFGRQFGLPKIYPASSMP
ncbi:hypothetical protein BU25DRAFT_406272 [Macroventuria anomochaeta]|uniref:Uncharacterized protein n=1 Tax=Macroventuria anomochaeta TaxID=301207 RepID=A0ACB6SG94_9PLEO|nr:uncharacterized protein BU25DRAFT_406272 [Macroventuria anomochaeta]KAF2632998.1 hypothetical protein BU25DRAFT_406272 [Macroventuria anomochaeta]